MSSDSDEKAEGRGQSAHQRLNVHRRIKSENDKSDEIMTSGDGPWTIFIHNRAIKINGSN